MTPDEELLLSPRIVLDLLEGPTLAETFEQVQAANRGALESQTEVRS
jgi:hypothetical protein